MHNDKGKRKPFLTYDEQINKLITEKGLSIHDVARAKKLLKELGYFALISGYKKPFKTKESQYKKNTSIEDILALYRFDDQLRSLILKNILIVENHIKSLITYSFCEINGDNQQHYLDATKYNYIPANQAGINKLIATLSEITRDPRKYKYILHQKECYENVPLWAMMHALTLGTVSKMYSFLPQNIQAKVAIEFTYIRENDLQRMLDLLSRVRNVCAHNERLFDYKYNKGAINDTYVHSYLKLMNSNGKSDLFAVIISLKYLLDENDFQDMIDDIDGCLDRLLKATHQVQRQQMYKYMGFPVNWIDIEVCPYN